ncbi:hypothetical protein CK203_028366 [Vitis vinifera]|uniref:Uncharacterized protein n=1 Tax=Vitis vinifera TaxID=29760 RepID=A0A438J066_VITVI|nr:hypothetical protein CK203_028366 [Vitis vinifera]
METENDQVAKKDYLDLLDISAEIGEKEDNKFFQWVRSLHLDDEDGNLDPRITAHVQKLTVIFRSSFNSTSVEHSSRPSATSTSTSGYDGSSGERTNDGRDPGNDGRDLRQQ